MTRDVEPFDLFVIGAGSGGVRAARTAAALGARVAIAEQARVGGTCVIRGCVPKKLLVTASRFRAETADATGFGWRLASSGHDWVALRDRVAAEVSRLEQLYRRGLDSSGVALINARATLAGPGRVRLASGDMVAARHIVMATGAVPAPLTFAGAEHCLTSDDVFTLPALPARIVIIGGGYIALEFAGIFNGLGAEVSIVHRGAALLRGFDADLQQGVASAYREQGIEIRLRAEVRSIAPCAAGYRVTDSTGRVVECDAVLNATGRVPDISAAGDALARTAAGAIAVDARYATSLAGVHAIGDAIGQLNLTPVAIRQGQWLAEFLFGHTANGAQDRTREGVQEGTQERAPDFTFTPTAVFSTPEIAAVGLTEQMARATFADVAVYRSHFRPLRAAVAGSAERVLMKLVVDAQSDRVLGMHMVGRDAAEIIQMGAVSLQHGVTKRALDQTVALHPSVAEEFVTMRRRE
ncbi:MULTISPECIES: FAD-dependent oxidoreductase [unclassified Cupriavidus]|uniref:FAD-dependent oxidoreductase n=1 Tax=Cupriavidus sp. H19C3 TaxID=3241603 RepID=UPI003BF892DF